MSDGYTDFFNWAFNPIIDKIIKPVVYKSECFLIEIVGLTHAQVFKIESVLVALFFLIIGISTLLLVDYYESIDGRFSFILIGRLSGFVIILASLNLLYKYAFNK